MNIIIDNLTKCECFTTIFQHIKNFTDSINISFKPDGLYVQTMDNSHVSIVELTIPKEWFSNYICEEDSVLGINVSILHKILNARDKTQKINIIYNKTESDKLEIHFLNIETSVKTYEKHFEIPLVDIENEHMSIPEINYQAEFSLSSINFSNIVSQLKMFGDTMEINCSEDNIILYSHSLDSGKMNVEINIDDLTEFSIDEGENLKLSFALSYLHNICAFHKLTKEIELKICMDYPLCARYQFEDSASIKFYLAPKVEDD